MHQINEIIIKRLDELERENALIKSQMRELLKQITQKEKSGKSVDDLIKSTVTLQFVNKLYGK